MSKMEITENIALGPIVVVTLLFFFAVSALFLIAGKIVMALGVAGIPIAFILATHPRLSIYTYIFTLFIHYYPIPGSTILLIDFVTLVFLASFVIDYLLNLRPNIRYPGVVAHGLALIGFMIISGIFAYNQSLSVKPILRVIFQIPIIIAFYNLIDKREIDRILKFGFTLFCLHSAANVFIFTARGGAYRVFGAPNVYYNEIGMLFAPVGIAFFLWARTWRESLFYGFGSILVIFGLLATQSRAPLITVVAVGILLVAISFRKGRQILDTKVQRKAKWILLGTALITAVIIGFSDIFKDVGERFRTLAELDSGTVWLRISLWKTALIAFWSDPLTGIGPGNYRNVDAIFPFLKFDAARLYVLGYSSHNIFFHYLAETGIFGALAMAAFYFKNYRTSRRLIGGDLLKKEPQVRMALFGASFAMFITIFYLNGWMWGQAAFLAPLLMALTAKFGNSIDNA